MPPFTKTFELASKIRIPAVGLGTWQSEPGQVREAVKVAIQSGYRHIDCAWAYRNEGEVGQGIKDSGVDRKDLFITSKLWNTFHQPEKVAAGLQETLDNLGLDHLDLYLMHWPVAFANQPKKGKPEIDWDLTRDPSPTWAAMEKLVEQGKTKHIGVSNFTIGRLEKLIKQAKIKPAVNQIESNLHCAQPDLVQWSHDNGVLLEAYSPLGSTGAPQLTDEVVKSIAEAHGASPAQVLISWQVARGLVVLPKSVTPQRIKENFESVELKADEVDRLNKRSAEFGTKRTVDPSTAWGVPDLWKEDGAAKL
ncbi:hypothetical protein JCM9279_006140 [Rhodotorula babjevae]